MATHRGMSPLHDVARHATLCLVSTQTASTPLLYRVDDAAQRLSVSRRTLYRLVASGQLGVVRLPSGRIRVSEAELKRFAEQASA